MLDIEVALTPCSVYVALFCWLAQPRRRNTAQTHLSKLSVACGSVSPVYSNIGMSVSVGMGMDRVVAQSNPGGNAIEQICQQAEMDVGEGVPVIRRHSYCLGGKQR